jgi:predicted MPP superfamily phosphohydrolase
VLLPHQKLQIVYAAIALVLSVLAWSAAGRLAGPARWFRRSVLAFGLVSGAGTLVLALLRPFARDIASFFVAVAITFYAGGFFVPLIAGAAAILDRATRTSMRVARVGLCLLPPCIALDALLVEPNRLVIREETVPLPAWNAGTPELRLVHLSDLQTVGPCAREDRALEEVRELRPDLVVVTGDYVAGPNFDTRPAETDARNFLAQLAAIAPTIVVAGHCEDDAVRARVFEGTGVRYLEDRTEEFDFGEGRRLRVAGLDPFKPDLRLPRAPRPAGTAMIVATHPPDLTAELDGMGVDLHLAGHTHGGQIALPFLGPPLILSRLPTKYARGLFHFDDHWLDVCAGLGMEGSHAPRIRFLCPPEIVLLRLVGARTTRASSE